MTRAELLARMHDIHVPTSPGADDLTAGWTVWPLLLAISLTLALWFVRGLRRRAWQRQARRELKRIRALADGGHQGRALRSLSVLLRRIAVHDADARMTLVGEPWLRALDERFTTDLFSTGPGRVIASAPYQRQPQIDPQTMARLLNIVGAGLNRPPTPERPGR